MQTALKAKQQESCTQFEVTTDLLRNLYKFNLTPVTKLVLLELTTCLNVSKNGAVVFPSVGYIAEVLGIGLTAAKKAINDLVKEGLIIKSKRDNVKGNYNKYLLRLAKIDFKTGKNENEYKYTQTNINGQKTANKPSENELLKQSDSDLFMITNNKEQKKEQIVKSGENVLTGDDLILYEYAKKKAKYNVDALIKKIKENGGDKKIIKEYKQKQFITKRALSNYQETQSIIEEYKEDKKGNPYTITAWLELGKKISADKKIRATV